MNRTIKDLREANEDQFKPRLPEIVDESVITEDDDFDAALLALNHLAIIADDLYSVVGEEEIKVTSDEIVAILNSYDVLSEIYEKYEGLVAMPSKEYDLDAFDAEVKEEVELQLEELDEADKVLQEFCSFETMSDKNLKQWLEDNWTTKSVQPEFKAELEKAAAEAKKRGVDWKPFAENMNETPDRFGSAVAKLQASLKGFQAKLKSGKYKDSENDLKKIISRIEDELKKLGVKNEDINEVYIPNPKNVLVVKNGELRKAVYNPNNKSIVANFSWADEIYYFRVQPNTWKELKAAENPTEYFNKNIKSKYKSYNPSLNKKLKEAVSDGTILTWTSKTKKWPFVLEVLGVDGSKLVELLAKADPQGKYERAGNDATAYQTKTDRDKAVKALEKFYKFVKEEEISTMDLGCISEEFDEQKFRRLATTGLVPDQDVAKMIVAMRNLDSGKELTKKQKDLVTSTFHSLIGMVTGDTTVFSKIQQKLKKD